MEIDPEEIKSRYDELSDDGLLSIGREDLTELGKQHYDAELYRRGLHPEAVLSQTQPHTSEALPSEGVSSESETEPHANSTIEPGEDWALVATFLRLDDADLARSVLESADVPVRMMEEFGSAYALVGGLHLMVPASFAEQAQEILGARVSDEDLLAQAEAADPGESADRDDRH
ncbi:MAG TPA: hypothetical protein VGR73_10945 [Bryobacteraceae bacterium]|nr:hypothetical protein [Bryobacteraceae bacterium]